MPAFPRDYYATKPFLVGGGGSATAIGDAGEIARRQAVIEDARAAVKVLGETAAWVRKYASDRRFRKRWKRIVDDSYL